MPRTRIEDIAGKFGSTETATADVPPKAESQTANKTRDDHWIQSVLDFYDSVAAIASFNAMLGDLWHTPLSIGPTPHADPIAYICSVLRITSDHRVLDFGSGIGATACEIAKRSGCRVRGLNVSKLQTEVARTRAKRLSLDDRVAFDSYGGSERLPYSGASFDRVVFFESPCHVQKRSALFREFHRILRPGGTAGGQDWMLRPAQIPNKKFERYVRPINEAYQTALGSLAEYRLDLEAAGFRAVRVIDAADAPTNLSDRFDAVAATVEAGVNVDVLDRICLGNAALVTAFRQGLFTIGWVFGERGRRSAALLAHRAQEKRRISR